MLRLDATKLITHVQTKHQQLFTEAISQQATPIELIDQTGYTSKLRPQRSAWRKPCHKRDQRLIQSCDVYSVMVCNIWAKRRNNTWRS